MIGNGSSAVGQLDEAESFSAKWRDLAGPQPYCGFLTRTVVEQQ